MSHAKKIEQKANFFEWNNGALLVGHSSLCVPMNDRFVLLVLLFTSTLYIYMGMCRYKCTIVRQLYISMNTNAIYHHQLLHRVT